MIDPFALDGKHVVVTGGSSGLGRGFAEFLAARGARVTVSARRAEALAKTVDVIGAAKGQAHSVVMDVTAVKSIETALDAAEARFGPVEMVINNAGVTGTRPALDQDESEWDKIVDTNLKGRLARGAVGGTQNGRSQDAGFHRQHRLDTGSAGCRLRCLLCNLKGRRCSDDQGAGTRMGTLRHPGQRARTRLFRDRTER